jgi:hypothetical protein
MAQPILWCQHAKAQRERTRVVGGKKVTEKVPQHGHDGKDADYDKPRLARGNRVWFSMDRAGNEVRVPITSAAADMNSDSGYARWMKAKFRHYGWIHVSECPCLLLKAGILTPDHLVDTSLVGEDPCEPGAFAPTPQQPDSRCPHYAREKAARMKQNAEDQKAFATSHANDLRDLVKEQRETTTQLVDVIREGQAQAAQVIAALADKRSKGGEK